MCSFFLVLHTFCRSKWMWDSKIHTVIFIGVSFCMLRGWTGSLVPKSPFSQLFGTKNNDGTDQKLNIPFIFLHSVNGREFVRSKTLPTIPIHQILGQDVIAEYGTPTSVSSTNTSSTALARIHHSKSSGNFRSKPPKAGFYLPGKFYK